MDIINRGLFRYNIDFIYNYDESDLVNYNEVNSLGSIIQQLMPDLYVMKKAEHCGLHDQDKTKPLGCDMCLKLREDFMLLNNEIDNLQDKKLKYNGIISSVDAVLNKIESPGDVGLRNEIRMVIKITTLYMFRFYLGLNMDLIKDVRTLLDKPTHELLDEPTRELFDKIINKCKTDIDIQSGIEPGKLKDYYVNKSDKTMKELVIDGVNGVSFKDIEYIRNDTQHVDDSVIKWVFIKIMTKHHIIKLFKTNSEAELLAEFKIFINEYNIVGPTNNYYLVFYYIIMIARLDCLSEHTKESWCISEINIFISMNLKLNIFKKDGVNFVNFDKYEVFTGTTNRYVNMYYFIKQIDKSKKELEKSKPAKLTFYTRETFIENNIIAGILNYIINYDSKHDDLVKILKTSSSYCLWYLNMYLLTYDVSEHTLKRKVADLNYDFIKSFIKDTYLHTSARTASYISGTLVYGTNYIEEQKYQKIIINMKTDKGMLLLKKYDEEELDVLKVISESLSLYFNKYLQIIYDIKNINIASIDNDKLIEIHNEISKINTVPPDTIFYNAPKFLTFLKHKEMMLPEYYIYSIINGTYDHFVESALTSDYIIRRIFKEFYVYMPNVYSKYVDLLPKKKLEEIDKNVKMPYALALLYGNPYLLACNFNTD